MWNNRYEPINRGGSSVTRELEAIIEKKRKLELKTSRNVKDLFDDKLYKSLKKIIVKITKAS